jgi:Zinc-binding dehydrogenase
LRPTWNSLFEWLQDGKISVPIKATFKLDEIRQAHREYASSARIGSIVIEPADSPLLRSINKAGKIRADGFTPKVIWGNR